MNWIKGIIWKIRSLFTRSESAPPPAEELPQPEPSQPPAPVDVQDGKPDFLAWTKEAMIISGHFENEGTDWGGAVGNFDGAGLTCGLLGFTWKWNNQPPMVQKFIKQHGEPRLFELMPKTGFEYIQAVKAGEYKGFSTVAGWSDGGERVHEPYRTELNAFWSSPEMKVIQTEKAWDMMGNFAQARATMAKEFFNLPQEQFSHFCYYFDQAVLNGQGSTVNLTNAYDTQEVLDWCASVGGYNKSSIRACEKLWEKQVKLASRDQLALFYMAYQRALKSRSQFMATTMTRRGTLALGIGVVNEKQFEYPWRVK